MIQRSSQQKLTNLAIATTALLTLSGGFQPREVKAAEAWVDVTVNAVGDRFLVDQNSIERSENTLRYWEYRQFQRPNNVFLDFEVEQPVYGVMLYRSVECETGVVRTRRVVVFDQERQVLQRVNYDDSGSLTQPMEGSSAATVIRYVCDRQ